MAVRMKYKVHITCEIEYTERMMLIAYQDREEMNAHCNIGNI